jgi:hypothetical protein
MGLALPDPAAVGIVAHGTLEKYCEPMLLSSRPLLRHLPAGLADLDRDDTGGAR